MSVTRKTPALDGLRTWLADLSAGGKIDPQLPAREAAKAKWLADAGRDFFQVTPELTAHLARTLSAEAAKLVTQQGNLRAAATEAALARATQAWVLLRFRNNGNDVRGMTRLSPATIARKLAKGQPSLIGRATDDLYKAVAAATFAWRR